MTDSVSVRRGAPVSSRVLFARFAIASLIISCLCGFAVAYIVPWMIDADAVHSPRMHTMGLWVALAFFIITVATAADTLLRTRPILRYLRSSFVADETAKPSPQAIEEASNVHRRATLAGIAAGAVVPLFEFVGVIDAIPLSPGKIIARDALCIVIAALAAQRISLVWAAGLWDWLGRLHPSLVVQEIPRAMAFRSARRVLLSLLAVLVPTVALTYSLAERPSNRLLAISVLLTVLVAFAMAILTLVRAHRLSEEIVTLASSARRLAEGDSNLDLDFHTSSYDTSAVKAALRMFSERIVHIATQRAGTYKAMEDAQRLKTQFFASMSHDLRSPLNSIVGFSDLLASESDGRLLPAQRESVRTVQKSASELLALLTDVLDSARLEAGRLPIRRAWYSVEELVDEAIERVGPILDEHRLQIEADYQSSEVDIYVDAERVVQMIAALLTYAARTTRESLLRVRVAQASGPPGPRRHTRIEISGMGHGIPESQKEALFEAFKTITESTGRRAGGLGLGLSLARGLARAHGGDVWYETVTSQGTTFCVVLPNEATSMPADPPSA